MSVWFTRTGGSANNSGGSDADAAVINGEGATMRETYQQFHVVCQPSRAEGFGMVGLEARASGVPLVATMCTGHKDHVALGLSSITVHHGPDGPIDDGPGAMAPSVSSSEILDSLLLACQMWPRLSEEAIKDSVWIRDRWSWPAVTRDFVAACRDKLKTQTA